MSTSWAQPTRGASLQPRIDQDGYRHDHDHTQRQGITQTWVVENIAADLGADEDGHKVERPARECISGGVGTKGVAKEEYNCPQQRGQEHRQGDVTPILKLTSAKITRGLIPFALETFQRGGDDQHHQRKLKIHVGETKTRKGIEIEAQVVEVDAKKIAQQHGHQPDAP